jgi:hypothetical protein
VPLSSFTAIDGTVKPQPTPRPPPGSPANWLYERLIDGPKRPRCGSSGSGSRKFAEPVLLLSVKLPSSRVTVPPGLGSWTTLAADLSSCAASEVARADTRMVSRAIAGCVLLGTGSPLRWRLSAVDPLIG